MLKLNPRRAGHLVLRVLFSDMPGEPARSRQDLATTRQDCLFTNQMRKRDRTFREKVYHFLESKELT